MSPEVNFRNSGHPVILNIQEVEAIITKYSLWSERTLNIPVSKSELPKALGREGG